MSETTDSSKNAFNTGAPKICQNIYCEYIHAEVYFPKADYGIQQEYTVLSVKVETNLKLK